MRTYTVGVVFLLLVALVWAAVWWFNSDSGDEPTTPTPSESVEASEPEPSESASPSIDYDGLGPSGLPSDSPACEVDAVEIQAMTDKTSYASDEPVMMRFLIVNTGDTPCQMNVGTTEQDYVISAGGETVFQSSHCMSNRVDQLVTLEPDEPRETTAIEWNRRYSDEGSCEDQLDRVPAGGTEYALTVVVAGIESQGIQNFVLE